MSKLQNYLTGYIDRAPNGQYRFINKNKVIGVYSTIAELVEAQEKKKEKSEIKKPEEA